MDRGYEQLVLLALFLLAALADWLVRWLKRKGHETTPTDDVSSVDAEIAAEREWLEARLDEESRMGEEARVKEEVRVEEAPAPVRTPATEEIIVRLPVRAVPSAQIVRRPRNARVRRLRGDPEGVRQAIVAMEVLGRCRGLEPRD
ncbi:MAG: hypothetical protein ACREOK_16090 [Gemmatimonadaceae bacterium]